MRSRNHKYRVVLFDFDGTLVNTTPLILRSFHATWQRLFGLTLADADFIRTFGLPLETAMLHLLEQMTEAGLHTTSADELTPAQMVSIYREFNLAWHDEMIESFAGMTETLQELKRCGCQLGVVTSKKRYGAERGMRLCGMQEFFDLSVCAEDTRNNKPHPEPLLHAMKHLAADPGETIYVGDSTHDMIAGRAAQIAVAAATWGPFTQAELAVHQPDYLLQSPADLPGLCAGTITSQGCGND